MSASVQSLITSGQSGIIVDIECHLSNNLPNIVIVGSASQAVAESRERIRGAFADSRIVLPRKRVTINLAPADVPKADSSFDLGVAVSILVASGQIPLEFTRREAFVGELGLDGSIRAVRGIIGKLLFGRSRGIETFYIPSANTSQAQLVPNVTIIPVRNLGELYDFLRGEHSITPIDTGDGQYPTPEQLQATSHNILSSYFVQVSEVVGQSQAKRALTIAAAGGHNLLLSGPPGTGKSMLAKALATILPPLTRDEMLEVTQLHSLASPDFDQIISQRPYRAPHHSASLAAITGGGMSLRPGELSLSHRGVLFCDEFPEFSHAAREALRQPMEDRIITISRIKDTVQYPADFILVATANPCPCGYYGQPQCLCDAHGIKLYRRRISGPILDRIDLFTQVNSVPHDQIVGHQPDGTQDQQLRDMIIRARARQAKRFGNHQTLNSSMTNRDISQLARLTPDAKRALSRAGQQTQLSARAYLRVIKVARTIADLDDSSTISRRHLLEAVSYRKGAAVGSASE